MFFDHVETDWLASRNIYYNTRTNLISDNINDLIEPGHIRFHPEGLCNYLDYGFSVFGQTIIEEIKLLEPNMRAWHDEKGKLAIEHNKDPFEELFEQTASEEDVLSELSTCINKWVNAQAEPVILPLSGGFDSRLILSFISQKDKVSAFTYGISEKQEESIETVYAKAVAERLGVKWEQIILGKFPDYIDEWYELYGVTTHVHGMYHMEFYDKIKASVGCKGSVISGILGDLFAGSWRFGPLSDYQDIKKLAITHGVHADSNYCLLKSDNSIVYDFYEKNKERLLNENWRVLTAARMKISLLSYLLKVPENTGFRSWSPFLDVNVVAKMMTLPWSVKNMRKWQVDYFKNIDLLVGEWGLKCSRENVLDHNAYMEYPFERLDYSLLGDLLKKEYIEGINDCLSKKVINDGFHERELNAWFTIYPIQRLLKETGN